MKLKEYFICFICLSFLPIASYLWIKNKVEANAYSDIIQDITLEEYIAQNVIEEPQEVVKENIEASGELIEYIEPIIEEPIIKNTSITMNFAGDCTIGSDSNFGYTNTFYHVYDTVKDDSYFFSNMQELFANDDLTVVNFEGTLTNHNVKVAKEFNFKAPPEYVSILNSGDIDVVNIANNHTKDYGEIGFADTKNTLKEYNVPYFGYEDCYIYEKDGVKIGFAGLRSIWDGTIYTRIDNAISYFNEQNCNAMIFSFHWGNERNYKQNQNQINVGHYAIDHGVDLVVGHHPHVIQGIENYKGKYIVYSLANFCFGGNTNPPDKDTFVFNAKFDFEEEKLNKITATIYPARVSSVNNKNDYKPTLAKDEEYSRIMNKILKYGNVQVDENGTIMD